MIENIHTEEILETTGYWVSPAEEDDDYVSWNCPYCKAYESSWAPGYETCTSCKKEVFVND